MSDEVNSTSSSSTLPNEVTHEQPQTQVSDQVSVPDSQTSESTTQETVTDWRTMELPPEAHGYGRSVGDLVERYRNSSREAREAASLRKQVQEYETKLKAFNQPKPQQTDAQAEFQRLAEEYAKDPFGSFPKMLEMALQHRPDLLTKRFDEQLQPFREQQTTAQLQAKALDFQRRYPEAFQDPTCRDVCSDWATQNAPILEAMHAANPDFNLTEMIYKNAMFDVMRGELSALKGKATIQRKAAATATSGGGQSSIPVGNSHDAIAERIKAKARAQGLQVDTAQIDEFKAAMEHAMPGFNKR